MNGHSRAHSTPVGQRGVRIHLGKTLPSRKISHAPNFIAKVGDGEKPTYYKTGQNLVKQVSFQKKLRTAKTQVTAISF